MTLAYGPSINASLNRTSVGLKHVIIKGIGSGRRVGSIEPAWD